MWSRGSLGADTGAPVEHMEQQLPWSTESSYAGACGAVALWEQIQVLQWSIMEQQRPWSTESSCIGARGAVATLFAHREPLLHVLQHSCSLCSTETAAPCAPVEQLCLLLESRCSTCSSNAAHCAPGKPLLHVLQWSNVSAPRQPLLHMLQQCCSLCSREAAAPCAPVEQLCLLLESRCSTRSIIAALCALGSSCSLCSSGAAVFATIEQLLHVLQQSCSLFSREAAAQSVCSCGAAVHAH